MGPCRRVPAIGCAVALAVATAAASGSGSAAAPPGVRGRTDSPALVSGALTAVSALSSTDVWVVGGRRLQGGGERAVVLHFDGTGWSRVGNLGLSGPIWEATSVQARSDDDVWVSLGSLGSDPSRVAHWNGSSWQTWPMPREGLIDQLWAADDTDVWAVGAGADVEHFDGTRWRNVHTPAPTSSELFGVSGSGPDDVWMVGQYPQGPMHTLIVHWDGTTWKVTRGLGRPGETSLASVAVLSPGDGWAAGRTESDSGSRGLTLHWNGKHWGDSFQQVLPNASLSGVSAVSPTDVWVGGYEFVHGSAVAAHWNGHAWHAAHLRLSDSHSALLGLSAEASDDVWAVGYIDGATAARRLVEHFDGTHWVRVQV